MSRPDDDTVEIVVRLPRSQVQAFREHHRVFLLRLQRDHDQVAMTGPLAAGDAEKARLDRLSELGAALKAGRAVTRAAVAAAGDTDQDQGPSAVSDVS